MEFYTHCLEQSKEGLSFVGVFHSHPNDPDISGYDRDVIRNTGKLYPELVWIVYGNQSQTFKAFALLDTNQFEEIPIISRHN
jgi:proteasome lid subunit RPN8/RPN11